MYRRVRIKKLPQARTGYQVQGSLANDVPAFGGADYNAYIGKPNLRQSKYITAVPRDEANLEAEGGETVYGDINGDGFPEHKIIKGPRHSEGGVPLSLPDDTFIFSDTKSMKINDPNVLQMFGKMPKKGKGQQGFTPADLAKQYDIDKYRKILQDPDSDHIAKKTAELMIRNYNMKLGALALAQEAKKGFPQGIPVVAKPYMEAMGLTEDKLLPPEYRTLSAPQGEEEMPEDQMQDPSQQYAYDDYDVENTPYETEEEMGMQPGMGLDQVALEGQMPQEQMPPMAMYGMEMGGYDMPFYNIPEAEYGMPMGANSSNYMGRTKRMQGSGPFMAREGIIAGGMLGMPLVMEDGGYLPKAPTGTETPKYKTYNEADLPAGTVVKNPNDMTLKVGDYVKQSDGTITKVTSAALKTKVDTQTKTGKRADFMNQSPDNKALMEKADKILEDAVARGQAVKVGDTIKLKGNLTLPFEDRILLSRALNSSPEFGTAKYKVGTQSMTTGYSRKVNNQFKGSGSFVAGFTPEDYEKRYLFEKARGFGLSDQEAFDKINQIYNDPTQKAELRKEYLSYLGKGNLAQGKTDADLLNPNFYKSNYYEITQGIESVLGAAANRPTMGDEQLSGFEHFDAAGLSPEFNYEPPEQPCPCKDDKGQTVERDADGNCPCPDKPKDCPCGKDPVTGECKPCDEIPPGKKPPVSPPAKWWLQDTIKTTGAFGDLMGIKKYMPFSPRVDLEEPRPTFLDPTRELAQQSEQANIAIMNLAAFAGPQALSARASSIQGTGAKSAANTLSQFNNDNTKLADAFEMKQVDIRNQEALANQAGQQKLYDANTIANQQFDNSRMALRNQMRNHYTNAITNKAKTATLNQLYPQYAVLPETGGMPGFKGGKPIKPEVTKSAQEYFDEIKQQYPDMDDKTAYQMAKDRAGTQTTSDNAMDVVNAQYNVPSGTQMRYGGFANGGFVYGDSIYPFFFT